MSDALSLDHLRGLDAGDPLKGFRADFVLPEGVIYLDGNSLGPAPKAALNALQHAGSAEWAQDLIRSWNAAGWFQLPLELGDRVGRLIGAAPGQVAVCDSTSINIFKALSAAAGLRPDRKTVLAEAGSFPTDVYIAEGFVASQPGYRLRLEGQDGASILDMLGPDVGVVLLNHVNYRSGRLADLVAVTRAIHEAGALVIWDLCHSAGALPIGLDAAEVDFAVGCSYKYLNGGPGAPAFIYVAERHQAAARQPLSGWWGHARPFAFETHYEGAPAIARFLCGTQPILSLRALKGALEVWDRVDLDALRAKSLQLTDLFIALVETRCADHGLALETPRDPAVRGSQVSFSHPHAYEIVQALIERQVIGDFRAPDVLRFGFTPLYLSHEDVWIAVETLRDILETGLWREPRFAARHAVT
ncbi:kynureninase [Paracoccus aminophilus]|uniref:Kynureninase n=1 Tax=Paracoccus aminophilus JCM 7686 TaxID=1367847 RepID=S5XZL8_PARAH|nr:kynureninase [Paracoccus aminophilus]AGT10737.1 kynureninase [Paracoccus aminophilus JCM 7686]